MENIVIIGDNKKILENNIDNFIEKIKVIYIDPPYNTKTTKSYEDKKENWLEEISNTISLSKKFLCKGGVIFISIDDNEFANLKVSCDKIFGSENFLGSFITNQAKRSNSKFINITHEYIIAYAKDKKYTSEFKISRMDIPEQRDMIEKLQFFVKNKMKLGRDEALKSLNTEIQRICVRDNITWLKNYSNIDENGEIYFAKDLSTPSKPNSLDIDEINLHLKPLKTRGWSSKEKFLKLYKENRLVFKGDRPYEKHLLTEACDSAPSILNFYSRQGTNDLNKLGLYGLFDTPKPVALIKFLIRLVAKKGDIVLDYFAGSGTTAQAVWELNIENNLDLNFILIQKDEKVNEKSSIIEACKKYNIEANVSKILEYRLNTYLSQNILASKYELRRIV